ATILSGTYPQTHHASELASSLPAGLPYLPDLLHKSGYRTAAFVGSVSLDPHNGLAPGLDRGFDTYDAGFRQIKSPNAIVERRGDLVVARATKWLSSNARVPFFIWVHIVDAHVPYATPYDRAVASADAAAGKLFSALRTAKLWDNSVVLVTGDHGESLGGHGEQTHGVFLYDETIHVPLLLKMPHDQLAGKQASGRVRLVDIAPTILEAAGLPVPPQMQGQSLLRIAKNNSQGDQPVYSRSDFPQQAFGWSALESWRAGKYLYIRAPKPELYDLVADPGATRNLAQSSKATLSTLAAQLESFDSHFGNKGGEPEGPGLSSSEVQKLASLGYIGIQKSAHTTTAVTGIDPKDGIATANQVMDAIRSVAENAPRKAEPVLAGIIAKNSDMYLAQYGLGLALAQQQQYAKAIEHLHKAIELQPDSAWAHYEMGASLIKTGDYKTAAVHLELAVARLPECSAAHLLLAESYHHLGRSKEANSERKMSTAH